MEMVLTAEHDILTYTVPKPTHLHPLIPNVVIYYVLYLSL